MAKMGSYGLVRAAESLPSAVLAAADWLAALAFISMLYGGVLAWRQRDLKAMVAYSSMSHMGVVLLGIATLNVAGLNGAVTQMVAHGLVAGALFLLVGLLYERTGSRDIADYTSLSSTMPRFAFFTVLAFVAAVGLPGTAGFVAELHAMVGGFARWGYWVVLLSLSVLVAAAFSLRTVGRLITSDGGSQGDGQVSLAGLSDMNRAELAAATVLASGVLVLGFYPAPLLNLVSTSVHQLAAQFGG
jgi:NADH-quinone oxidoreductase subunit M